jgi:hypothetical protein
MYVVGYAVGRFWIEGLRIDPAHTTGGLRINQWVAIVAAAAALLYLAIDQYHHPQLVESDEALEPLESGEADEFDEPLESTNAVESTEEQLETEVAQPDLRE